MCHHMQIHLTERAKYFGSKEYEWGGGEGGKYVIVVVFIGYPLGNLLFNGYCMLNITSLYKA